MNTSNNQRARQSIEFEKLASSHKKRSFFIKNLHLRVVEENSLEV